jgi:hypothetical protein
MHLFKPVKPEQWMMVVQPVQPGRARLLRLTGQRTDALKPNFRMVQHNCSSELLGIAVPTKEPAEV